MKKRLMVLLLASMMMALVACGNETDSNIEDSNVESTTDVEESEDSDESVDSSTTTSQNPYIEIVTNMTGFAESNLPEVNIDAIEDYEYYYFDYDQDGENEVILQYTYSDDGKEFIDAAFLDIQDGENVIVANRLVGYPFEYAFFVKYDNCMCVCVSYPSTSTTDVQKLVFSPDGDVTFEVVAEYDEIIDLNKTEEIELLIMYDHNPETGWADTFILN